MKKIQKRIISFLAVLAVGCVSLGFVACGDNVQNGGNTSIEHTHAWNEHVTKKTTCISNGEITYSCYCGESYTVSTKAYGHTLQSYEGKEETCTEFGWGDYELCVNEGCGYTTYKEMVATGHDFSKGACLICGREDVGEHEHEWDDGVVTTQPTCMSQGIITYTCWCEDTKVEPVRALGHDKEAHVGEDATCTEIGWKAYETCKREGCAYTTYEKVSALGHNYNYGTCQICGYTNSHLSSTKVIQAKQKDLSTGGEYEAEFMYAYDIEDIRFLQFRVGKIENCFIQTLMNPINNEEGLLEEIVYETSMVTSTSVSRGISNSISTTESVSIAKSKKETISWDFTVGTEVSTSSKMSVNVGIIDGLSLGKEKEFSASVNTAYTYGETNENATSAEISNGVAEETNSSFNMEELQQMGQSISYKLNMEKMAKGLFYALCLVADVEIYQIIGYNVITGELYTTYFVSGVQGNPAMSVLSSKNASFEITPEYQIAPISEIDVELEEIRMISVEFEENGGNEITNILIRENQSFKDIPIPERTYYTFKGWYTSENFDATTLVREDTCFSANITLYAKWERNTVKLMFDSRGGSVIPDQIINQGDTYTLPISLLEWYNFDGWLFDGVLYNKTTITATKDMNFVAQWSLKTKIEGTYERNERLTSPDGKYTWISDDDGVNAKRGLRDDIVLKDCLGYDLETLKNHGFKTITIEFKVYIRERDDGYQQIYLSNNWKTAPSICHKEWETHDESKEINTTKRGYIGSVTIDIDNLEDIVYFTYEARGDSYDSWYNEGLYVEVTANK